MRTPAAGLLFLGALVGTPAADTFVVAPDGSGDHPNIQAAVDAAADGDVVELMDGTFAGEGNRDVDFLGKAVTIRSQSGDAAACVVDCQGTADDRHRGFLFVSGEGPGSILENLTITGGYASGAFPENLGGAVQCRLFSSPTIRGCRFEDNYADWGGGVGCQTSAAPELEECDFSGNTADRGGALYCDSSSPQVVECRLAGNGASRGGAVYCQVASSPEITRCILEDNSSEGDGGAIYCTGASPVLEECTFVRNAATRSGGGVHLSASSPQVMSCTFYGNAASGGAGGIGCDLTSRPTVERTIIAFGTEGEAVTAAGGSVPALSCCDLYGNAGGDWIGPIEDQLGVDGNIAADPLFCDAAAGDLTIDFESPCAPFTTPNENCDLIGAWPEACGTPPATVTVTWGRIKAAFD